MIGAHPRPISLIAAMAAVTLVAAGCGGDGDGSSGAETTAATLSRSEFVKQGNQICTDGNEEIRSRIEEFAEENDLSGNVQPTATQIEELAADILIPSIDKQVAELRDLGAPSDGAKEVDAYLDHAESAVEELKADPSLLIGSKESPLRTVNLEAVAIGLRVCAQEV